MFPNPRRVAADPLDDAALSLICPGLGQFRQGRLLAGSYFTLEAVGIVAATAVLDPPGLVLLSAVLAVTLWAMLDAYLAARQARNQCALGPHARI